MDNALDSSERLHFRGREIEITIDRLLAGLGDFRSSQFIVKKYDPCHCLLPHRFISALQRGSVPPGLVMKAICSSTLVRGRKQGLYYIEQETCVANLPIHLEPISPFHVSRSYLMLEIAQTVPSYQIHNSSVTTVHSRVGVLVPIAGARKEQENQHLQLVV